MITIAHEIPRSTTFYYFSKKSSKKTKDYSRDLEEEGGSGRERRGSPLTAITARYLCPVLCLGYSSKGVCKIGSMK